MTPQKISIGLSVLALTLMVLVMPNQAEAGFFSCLSDSGTMISAGMDGEVNLSNFRVQKASVSQTSALKIYEITVEPPSFEFRAHGIQGQEDNTGYDVRTRKMSGSFYKGTLQTNNGEALGPKEKVICTVKFNVANERH